uniref:PB1-like domain-containing protein n=1 Tax=Tanacetum cinerariifolium TaxID=118510 RepID=A0A6L2LPP1_TANCI|nr:hypothetical protein [Tanacetum cinerariifolium]
MKELNDTNFDEMSYEHLKEIALRLITHACFEKIYYCQTGAKLSLGVRELKSTQDIANILKVGYDNENEIDMYVEHFGNVEDERCAGKKGNKDRVMKNKVCSGVQIGVRKKVKKKIVKKKPVSNSGEGTSQSPKWTISTKCATFENGIYESFNRAILGPRHKPIITMLEEIRLYFLQRLVAMNKHAFNLEDRITSSIRKRLEILKEKQREYNIFPSGFQDLEVRKDDQSYNVSLQHKKMTNDVPPLPPLVRRFPCRPQKARIKAPCESSGRKKQVVVGYYASRGRGRGRGVIGNEASCSGMGGIGESSGGERGGSGGRGTRGGRMASSGGRKGGGKGSRGVGSTRVVWVKDTTDVTTKNINEAPTSETTDVSAMVKDLPAPTVDKGKGKESVEDQANAPKKKRGRPPSHVDGIRIYHKNRGRSERIANIKEKKAFQFDKHGTCSTPDKVFDVDD